LLIAVFLCAPAGYETSTAQIALDVRFFTCGQFLASNPGRRDVITGWLSGYVNAERGQSTTDITAFERNRRTIEQYCDGHKEEALMSAIQRIAK
jgi:hypothetical protein